MLIELLNLTIVIGKVGQIAFLMEIKNGNEEVNPAGHFTWLKQKWKNFHLVAHIEDFAKTNHYFWLVSTLRLLNLLQ
jgi:hypothetical protein